jgi:tetratricopeptide (TPR) repeat protein
MSLMALHRCEEALACFEKALAIKPLYPRALIGTATLHDALGNRREAARSFRKFLEIASPENEPQAASLIAQARLRLRALEPAGN